ncbi:zinc ABC transporter substrate-binding protein [Parachlamydia sp. AcF125]|uniref:metal ABC transporter solute-binding protein, Zn/Mn family n=1 Tax=Parachlamydia sp. AcF125 TaxID=2795736 RepID=UPI001BC8E716|nr:zinc ABC transporter substrate-binding protein [Parachlamydia sp. AcF125]MBS4167911.1 Periplasmic zinc-binding protein TroA [Parachlamydia sp. AcF125]
MKRFSLWAFFLSLILWGCASEKNSKHLSTSQERKIPVLSTTAMINDLVKKIGESYIEDRILIPGELDPHSYQLVKGDDEKLTSAKIIFYNGLELEHGPSLKQYLQKSPKAISLGNKILSQNPHTILQENGQFDPHIWMDMSLWAQTVPFIAEKLSEIDPEHAKIYQERAETLYKTLLEIHQEIRDEMQQIPGPKRFLVTSHDAFNYFARAYLAEEEELSSQKWKSRFAAPEGLAPDSQLSAFDIQNVIDHLKNYHIHVLFPESNVSKDSIRKIIYAGKEHGLNLIMAQVPLYGDAMGPPGSSGDTYVKMIQHNARTIKHYLLTYPDTPKYSVHIQESCHAKIP